eukprot:Em0001g2044a
MARERFVGAAPVLKERKAALTAILEEKFLAGGNLTATKDKPGSPSDIRPIAVGKTLRRLVGKCLCQITKGKASDYFSPHQFGVACPSGAEKIVHGLRSCIEEHQNEQDFVVMKIDLRNAFNFVSSQAILDECSAHFPELLQWAAWCYGQHPLLWSPMGTIMSESGVQQGDPLGPLLFCLVLQKVLSAIASDPNCFDVLFHAWYIDDGVIAGSKQAVVQALSIIQDLGPPLGLVINSSKCELYGDCDLQPFPSEMKKCNAFNFEILGAPIGDTIFCAKFIAEKRAGTSKFLALLKEVGSLDSQVALVLLHQCGGFCKFVHIARCTPPSLASEGLHFFDIDVRQCFSDCLSIDLPNTAWQQAQLCLSRGGLGLRSLSQHSAAAYVASSAVSGSATNTSHHLHQSIDCFNSLVSPADVTSTDELLTSLKNQKELSSRIEHSQFQALFESSSLPNRARLLSVASPHAALWLSVVPSPGLNLHLESAEFQTAIKWWLGIDLFSGDKCPCCLTLSLDPLGHHALTCRHNGDVVSRHNRDLYFHCNRKRPLLWRSSTMRRGIGCMGEVFSNQGRKEHAANCYRTALDLELMQPFFVCPLISGSFFVAYVQKDENDICDDGIEIAEAEDWESTVKENRSSLHPCLIHLISLHIFSTVISSPSVNNTLDCYQRSITHVPPPGLNTSQEQLHYLAHQKDVASISGLLQLRHRLRCWSPGTFEH